MAGHVGGGYLWRRGLEGDTQDIGEEHPVSD